MQPMPVGDRLRCGKVLFRITMPAPDKSKSLESWIWDAACSIRGAKDAPKYKDYILPLIFTKRLCDVFDDEINRIAVEVGSRRKAFQLARARQGSGTAVGTSAGTVASVRSSNCGTKPPQKPP